MKTRFKLAIIIACFVTIAIIVLNAIVSNRLKELKMNLLKENLTKTAASQSQNISAHFQDIINREKEIVTDYYIVKFTEYSNLSEDEKTSAKKNSDSENINSYQENCNIEISNIKNFDSNVEEAIILNNDGMVVASTNQLTGNSLDNSEYLMGVADGNGISDIFMYQINNLSMPAYYTAANIYSDDGEKQGVFLQICNIAFLQKLLNFESLTVDSSGNVLEYPYEEAVPYYNNNNYAEINDYLKNIISKDNSSSFINFAFKNEDSTAYNVAIPNTNWSIVDIFNDEQIYKSIKPILFDIRMVSICLEIILIFLIIMYVFQCTKKIEYIIDVLAKKQHGDINARFNIESNDEFGQVGNALNSIFDDIFESEQRYRTIVEMTDNIVFEINFKKNSVFLSDNFNQKFGFRAKSANLQDSFFYKGRIHKHDKERYGADFEKLLSEVKYLQGEYRFKNIFGDFGWVMIRATKFFDHEGAPTKVIGVIVDIDKEKRSEIHLLKRANFDALTQLYNRETFIQTLKNEFELSSMHSTIDAVLFIDLDDFKHFNDEFGHACGDEVLKFSADCLKENVTDKGFVGRFGGDEFVICLNNQSSFEDPGKVAQDIIDSLKKGFILEMIDQKIIVNCSIGIAFFHKNGKNYEEVLNAADEAMYAVKRHGKSNFGYASELNSSQINGLQKNVCLLNEPEQKNEMEQEK